MRAKWLHIDLNAYFASLLQQENPYLRGKPVGVIKDVGRSCIIAASKEAKLLGVQTGCRRSDALLRAPDMVFVPASWTLSLATTKKFVALLQRTVPTVELFSLDEAFLFLDDCQKLYPNPLELAQRLQQEVKEELGEWMSCNIGLAQNRLLAKLSSERSPKGSITVVREEDTQALLAEAEFVDICGIGYRLEKRLRQLGVDHPWGINLLSDEELQLEFGPHFARELRKMGLGEEPAFLAQHNERALRPMKSVGRSITGYKLCSDAREIRRVLRNLVEEAVSKARQQHLAGREVWVSLSGHNQYWREHILLQEHLSHSEQMYHWVKVLLERWEKPFPVIKFAVRLGRLESTAKLPRSLLPAWEKQERLAQACDAITKKFGLFTVRPGVLLDPRAVIRPEVTGFLGDQPYQLRSQSSW